MKLLLYSALIYYYVVLAVFTAFLCFLYFPCLLFEKLSNRAKHLQW